MRYNSVAVEEDSELKKLVPLAIYRPVLKTQTELGTPETLFFEFLKEYASKSINLREGQRTSAFKKKMLGDFFEFLRDESKEKYSVTILEFLRSSETIFEQKRYFLCRMDFAANTDLYETAKKSNKPEWVRECLVGEWTSDPAQTMRSSLVTIETLMNEYFGNDSETEGTFRQEFEMIKSAVESKEICKRTQGTNRHGHCMENPFPGPIGYTDSYKSELERRTGRKLNGYVLQKVENMKRYSTLYKEAMEVLNLSADRSFLISVVQHYEDPNCFEIFRSVVFGLFYEKITEKLQELGHSASDSLTQFEELTKITEKEQKEWFHLKIGKKNNLKTIFNLKTQKIRRMVSRAFG